MFLLNTLCKDIEDIRFKWIQTTQYGVDVHQIFISQQTTCGQRHNVAKIFLNSLEQIFICLHNVPLDWYSSMKKMRRILIISDIVYWLWKSEIGNFSITWFWAGVDLPKFFLMMKKCYFSLNKVMHKLVKRSSILSNKQLRHQMVA